MKARLVVKLHEATKLVYALKVDEAIPDGWEEVELAINPLFTGTKLVKAEPTDLCVCEHQRQGHIQHKHGCMERIDDRSGPASICPCQEFREAE